MGAGDLVPGEKDNPCLDNADQLRSLQLQAWVFPNRSRDNNPTLSEDGKEILFYNTLSHPIFHVRKHFNTSPFPALHDLQPGWENLLFLRCVPVFSLQATVYLSPLPTRPTPNSTFQILSTKAVPQVPPLAYLCFTQPPAEKRNAQCSQNRPHVIRVLV